MSCGVGQRCGSDLALLCLWQRLAVVAPIQPLAWELPCATDAALEKAKTKTKTKKQNLNQEVGFRHGENVRSSQRRNGRLDSA